MVRFDILNCFYTSREFNTIPFVDKKYYKVDFLAAPSKNIFFIYYDKKNYN